METIDYWKECISIAAEECGLTLSEEQLTRLASSAESGHDFYGMSYYSPPSSGHSYQDELEECKATIKLLRKKIADYEHPKEPTSVVCANVR